jgi:hypothetical protein
VGVAQKLQIKPGMTVAVLDAPPEVVLDLPDGSAGAEPDAADAVIQFVRTREELIDRDDPVVQAARRDALAWIAYPKAGQLGTDLNRDSLAELVAERGTRAVRQVAIDDVWSALRFRPT